MKGANTHISVLTAQQLELSLNHQGVAHTNLLPSVTIFIPSNVSLQTNCCEQISPLYSSLISRSWEHTLTEAHELRKQHHSMFAAVRVWSLGRMIDQDLANQFHSRLMR